jgi:TPR repeat protein
VERLAFAADEGVRIPVMFEPKPLSREAIPAALEKANRYRLLNEPGAAESICLDVLAVDPDNQEALVAIVLAMSDRFGKDYSIGDTHVNEYLKRISDEYQRAYYAGIVYERRAKATLLKNGVGAYELFRQAMECFERAETMRPAGNDDPILRWNGCARVINRNRLGPIESPDDFIE